MQQTTQHDLAMTLNFNSVIEYVNLNHDINYMKMTKITTGVIKL